MIDYSNNCDRHIILYAKGWYEHSEDYIRDLKVIRSKFYNLDHRETNNFYLLTYLTHIYEEVMSPEQIYYKDPISHFLNDSYTGYSFTFKPSDKVEDWINNMICYIYGKLTILSCYDRDNNPVLKLGEPDPTVFQVIKDWKKKWKEVNKRQEIK